METREIQIGKIKIGGKNKIAIQSMCTTRTHDVDATVAQILELENEGCDIIRVAVPDEEAANAIPEIKKHIHIPLVADIHFDYRLAIKSLEQGADKIRINPGNIAGKDRVAEILKIAKVPIRIGVNSGSVERELLDKYGGPTVDAMVESALRWVKFFEEKNFHQIVLSIKSTNLKTTIESNKKLALRTDYPLHIGMTEAGTLIGGTVKNALGIGTLLREGIGNTIRVSLTEDPKTQVKIAKEILKSLGINVGEPEIISCPTCGRTEIDLKSIAHEVEKRASGIKKPIKIAVMGCVVNGPGEAREADYGIAGGKGMGAIFRKGKVVKSVPENELVDELFKLIEADLK